MNSNWLILLIFVPSVLVPTTSERLTCDVIAKLDGKSYGFSGTRIGGMIHMKIKLCQMLFGIQQQGTTQRKGTIFFQDTYWTIQELAQWCEKNSYDATTEHELHLSLEKTKKEIAHILEPFIEQARGVKAQITLIIEEWISLYHKSGSPLENWARTKEGKELALFFQETVSYERLATFCSDLILFLEVLTKSCVDGMKQFEKLKEQHSRMN